MKLDEIAKLAGVSCTTVSYVVNGKAKQYRVSDSTIEKVQALIKQYDFKPNAMAASLRVGKSKTIGLVIPDFENISYAKIANNLENRLREKGYQLLIACSNDKVENEQDCVKHLLQRQVDALLVSSALPPNTDFYQNASVPIIGFDRRISSPKVVNALTDDEGDAYRLTKESLKIPHQKRILFFGALPDLPTSREREEGFRSALRYRKASAKYLYGDMFRKNEAAQCFAQWLENNPLPTAIFTTSFTLLEGVLLVLLQKLGQVPKDLVIATFGHVEMLELLENRVLCSVQDYDKVSQSLLTLTFDAMSKKHKNSVNTTPLTRSIIKYHC
ncbi:catabolite repressor/activator [Aggregatibacter actinomycetemcomitans]|uniref:catabolite repressor/activator n=1 Tax=Aggregatibacter actinomycetemcomitans TaxID=714 RepID=UPI0011DA5A6C|nr:catabolite repressor/activator [Aggregatibacter actinomycetemcomitans]TYA89461.1 catabolite repressor/activator [Aggregatibacter actinomycetemcomitans]